MKLVDNEHVLKPVFHFLPPSLHKEHKPLHTYIHSWPFMVFARLIALLRSVERAFHRSVRRPSAKHRSLMCSGVAFLVFLACFPLIITNAPSFGHAVDLCRERRLNLDLQMKTPPDDWKSAENNAASYIYPIHAFNLASTLSSFLW
jgi:hypothetical protein